MSNERTKSSKPTGGNKKKSLLGIPFFIVVVVIASFFGTIGKELASNTQSTDSNVSMEKNKTAFVSGCEKTGGNNETCSCVFEAIVDKFGFETYQKNNHIYLTEEVVDFEYIEYIFKTAPKMCKEKYGN